MRRNLMSLPRIISLFGLALLFILIIHSCINSPPRYQLPAGPTIEKAVLQIPAALPPGQKTPQQIYKEARYLAEIHVIGKRNDSDEEVSGIGSGFLIKFNNKYLVLTAAHVIRDSRFTVKEITVYLKGKPDGYSAEVDKVSADNLDCATLKFGDPNFKFTDNLAMLHLQKDFEVGDDVYSLGSPMGIGYAFGRGILMNLDFGQRKIPGLDWRSVIVHNATIAPGSSGGPLVDQYGRVIGMNVALHPTYQNYQLATFITDILDWLATQY